MNLLQNRRNEINLSRKVSFNIREFDNGQKTIYGTKTCKKGKSKYRYSFIVETYGIDSEIDLANDDKMLIDSRSYQVKGYIDYDI
jgi:hypothetical protein